MSNLLRRLAYLVIFVGCSDDGRKSVVCGRDGEYRAFTERDEWHTLVSPGEKVNKAKFGRQVPDEFVLPVAPASVEAAIELLHSRDAVELNTELAGQLTGLTSLAIPIRNSPYLCRAVRLNRGKFKATWFRDDLWVEHFSMGAAPRKMVRHPVVVFLEGPPERVIVIPWMAE